MKNRKKKISSYLWTLVWFLLLIGIVGSVYKIFISKESPSEFNTLGIVFNDPDKLCPSGENIWVKDNLIYFNNQSKYCVLDEENLTWTENTLGWLGFTQFDGKNVWTDGENIYYSSSNHQYILKGTRTWEIKAWNISYIAAENIWTDGENIYYSSGAFESYILDKETSRWIEKAFVGYVNIYGKNIWTDGDDIFYSGGNVHYKFNKNASSWEKVNFYSLSNFYGQDIWTDGNNAYYSNGDVQYVLHKESLTWRIKSWNGLTSFNACDVWTDGERYFVTQNFTTYKFTRA